MPRNWGTVPLPFGFPDSLCSRLSMTPLACNAKEVISPFTQNLIDESWMPHSLQLSGDLIG